MVHSELQSNPSTVEIAKKTRRKESAERKKRENNFQLYAWTPRSIQTFGHTSYVDDIENIFLVNRGYTIEDAESLKNPRIPSAEEAGLNTYAMHEAGKRFQEAARKDEKVLIYGDSDADGVVSTFILYEMLQEFGIKNVKTVIPARDDYGYGFNDHAAEVYGGNFDLIIPIDCGITAHDQIQKARDKGSDVIVIDHHAIQVDEYPQETTVLHTSETSAAGIAYLLTDFYHKNYGIKMPDVIGLAGIAVYADSMSMTRVNHPIVKAALESIRKKTPEYLSKLEWGKPKSMPRFSEEHISFTFSPLLNTPGRYGEGVKSLKLLRSKNSEEMQRWADELIAMNNIRKGQGEELLDDLRTHILKNKVRENYFIYSIDDKKYTFVPTFIDPITTRLMRDPRINRTVLLGMVHQSKEFDEKVCMYQSRTPWGSTDLLPLIRVLKERGLCIRGGGHSGAIGFTTFEKDREAVEALAALYFKENAQGTQGATKEIDCEIPFNPELFQKINTWQDTLRPFSYGLDAPIFLTKNVKVLDVKKNPNKNYEKNHHLYITVSDTQNENSSIAGVIFNAPSDQLQVMEGDLIDIVYTLGTNSFKGVTSLQLKLEDFRKADGSLTPEFVPPLPMRETIPPVIDEEDGCVYLPEDIHERLKAVTMVGFDMDDTLKVRSKMTELRYACFEAWAHSGDEYFREMYSKVEYGSPSWNELEERICRASEEQYSYSSEIFPNGIPPRDRILNNAHRHSLSFKTDDERGELYADILGLGSAKELWDYFRGKFNRGMVRRVDEFDLVTPGAVSLLNYLTQELGMDTCLISNSKSHELLDMEKILSQEGFKGSFARKISAQSMNKSKPDPYSLRNIFLDHPQDQPATMAYIGNSTGDVAFATNFSDFENHPSPHQINTDVIDIVPILVTRGMGYSDFDLPPHAQFHQHSSIEKYFRSIPLKPNR